MNLFSLGGIIENAWTAIWISLNAVVYQIIEWLYQVFEAVAEVNLFSPSAFDKIINRIYIVIGIAMLFIFAYNIILMIINPDDKKTTGNTGKIVKETMIAFVLIILMPTIFNYMNRFQTNLLNSHIIEQIVFGSNGGTEVDCDFSSYTEIDNYVKVSGGGTATNALETECKNYNSIQSSAKKGAYIIAPTIFTAFFYPVNYGYAECLEFVTTGSNSLVTTDDDKELCAYYVNDVNEGKFKGGIMPFIEHRDIYTDAWNDLKIFEFNYLLAIISGGLAVYMFICYTMAIGTRVAKLGFLQIISPIPVMLRIIPKKKEAIYDKWFKNLIDTYLDVFLRLLIIYFSLFAITLVPDVIESLMSTNSSRILKGLSLAIVILGILMFAQEAPALFKELFGFTGKFSLKSPKQQFNENKYAKGALGAAGAFSAVTGKKLKDIPSSFRNIKNAQGFKNKYRAFRDGSFNVLRGTSQQIGALTSGFKKGQEAQSLADMRDGIYSTAAKELSKATIEDKAGDFLGENWGAFTGFYKARYNPYNSPAELRKAEKLEAVESKQKAFEALLDNSDEVHAVESNFEGIRKQLQEAKGNFVFNGEQYDMSKSTERGAAFLAFEKALKDAKGVARGLAYKAKKNDEDVKAAREDYIEEINKNIDIVNEAREKNWDDKGGTNPFVEIKSADTYLSDLNIINNYKDTRDAGSSSGKHAKLIRQKALKEEQKAKGGSK